MLRLLPVLVCVMMLAPPCGAQEPLTLDLAVERALSVNFDIKSVQKEEDAAKNARQAVKARFYPLFSAGYTALHNDDEEYSSVYGVTSPENRFTFKTWVTQPVFTGFDLTYSYRIAGLGVLSAAIQTKVLRRAVILETKTAFFNVLKTQKLRDVAKDAVELLVAHEAVAKSFFEVGATPRNDWLKAKVELANARQDLVVAQNNLDLALARLNIILQNHISTPLLLADTPDDQPLALTMEQCLEWAKKRRPEIKHADYAVETAGAQTARAKKGYYPTVNMEGTYTRDGTDPIPDGGEGVSDRDAWKVAAVVSWDFWNWGRTDAEVRQAGDRLEQAKIARKKLDDDIRLEVTSAFLQVTEAWNNIEAVKAAVAQAEENLRITREQYKGQVATSTDVLDARTLLSRTYTNFFSALYDFNIAKARLQYAAGDGMDL